MNYTIRRQLTVTIENQPGRAGRFLVLLHEAPKKSSVICVIPAEAKRRAGIQSFVYLPGIPPPRE